MKCGAIFSGYDARDYKLVYTASAQKKFPQSFTLDMKNVRIKDQGNVGSCVAHSLSSIIEFYNYHQTHTDKQMSVGYIYGNRSTSDYKDEGMVMRDALEAVHKYGDVEYSLFPYNEEVPAWVLPFIRYEEIISDNVGNFPLESIGLERGANTNNKTNKYTRRSNTI